ncbi:hypothetical protein HWN40_00035 [Methanolobus zinderi]|jgi:hypothetical protein|uniref:Class III signal peptide-containing protein n=1 Tax=Methanolobus zinderi TaxID=536044 RepID=A0A7D5E6D4_9EURY|nr:hypothetical protein [Methanolobus zinderi]KXS40973.1 MAG: hypothetical protein AWU59_2302 [Methanolobus sp. T82-4]QLC48778.1 hypothetical protein HWN40_00035 [Methanolobus zinderi]
MKNLFKDEKGASLLFEYILVTLICIGFFMTVTLNSNEIFIKTPNEAVMQDEMSDVGNMMSTMITDMYLVLPPNGNIDTGYRIPEKVGRENYVINANIAYTNQIIEVISASSGKNVRVTIGGIARTMPINGTASSSSTQHVISYDSTR